MFKRVEQEMRIQLHSQGIQSRFCKAPFHPLQPQLRPEILLVILKGLHPAHYGPVEDQAPEEPPQPRHAEHVGGPQCGPVLHPESRLQSEKQVHVDGRHHQARGQVCAHAPADLFCAERQPPVNGHYERNQQSPGPELRKPLLQRLHPAHVGDHVQRKNRSEHRQSQGQQQNLAGPGPHHPVHRTPIGRSSLSFGPFLKKEPREDTHCRLQLHSMAFWCLFRIRILLQSVVVSV